MIHYCQKCRYLFILNKKYHTCPDCGSPTIRPATKPEQEEYENLRQEFGPVPA